MILDRMAEEAAEVGRKLTAMGGHGHSRFIDLYDLESIPRTVAEILAEFGRIDILVNCAGIEGGPGTILDLELETWERTHRVDLTAPFLMMQRCARAMVDGGRGGRIVNVTSEFGLSRRSDPDRLRQCQGGTGWDVALRRRRTGKTQHQRELRGSRPYGHVDGRAIGPATLQRS